MTQKNLATILSVSLTFLFASVAIAGPAKASVNSSVKSKDDYDPKNFVPKEYSISIGACEYVEFQSKMPKAEEAAKKVIAFEVENKEDIAEAGRAKILAFLEAKFANANVVLFYQTTKSDECLESYRQQWEALNTLSDVKFVAFNEIK